MRVNAVSPGFFYTELVRNALSAYGEVGKARWQASEIRQGRRAALEELGDAVTLLSAPGMSFVNGQNIAVDKYVFLLQVQLIIKLLLTVSCLSGFVINEDT